MDTGGQHILGTGSPGRLALRLSAPGAPSPAAKWSFSTGLSHKSTATPAPNRATPTIAF
jgi:hypothetical protein